jgi:hypothetical protein
MGGSVSLEGIGSSGCNSKSMMVVLVSFGGGIINHQKTAFPG